MVREKYIHKNKVNELWGSIKVRDKNIHKNIR